MITEWVAKEKQRAEDAAAKAKAEAEPEAAVKQGEFKALYEKTMAQLEAAEASRQALELGQLYALTALGLLTGWRGLELPAPASHWALADANSEFDVLPFMVHSDCNGILLTDGRLTPHDVLRVA